MPIAITLSDEAAGEIMRQITEGLTRRPLEKIELPGDIYQRGIDETCATVAALSPGGTLRVVSFARLVGCPTSAVSDALQRLKRAGEVEMVHKGMWRKITQKNGDQHV